MGSSQSTNSRVGTKCFLPTILPHPHSPSSPSAPPFPAPFDHHLPSSPATHPSAFLSFSLFLHPTYSPPLAPPSPAITSSKQQKVIDGRLVRGRHRQHTAAATTRCNFQGRKIVDNCIGWGGGACTYAFRFLYPPAATRARSGSAHTPPPNRTEHLKNVRH